MSITEKFGEIFFLSFEDLDLDRSLKPADLLPSDRIFIRVSPENVTLHYLQSSDQVIVPKEMLNLFKGVDRLLGEYLKDPKTGMEMFLFLGSRFFRMLYGGSPENIESLISRMIKVGSKDLRRHLRTEYDYTLGPITLRNIKNTIEI